MNWRSWQPYTLFGMWFVLVLAALTLRPVLPVDETRYLSVAWEMWRTGDVLVLSLNGEPYSHKPPLLFWLINLGWSVFGVNDWWARLVAPLFGLGSLWLMAELARLLWPTTKKGEEVALLSPFVALGAAYWTIFTTVTFFDMLVVFFALLSLFGLMKAYRSKDWRYFGLYGLGIGLGVLSKGPVILLFALPVALTAPWWIKKPAFSWRHWYLGVLLGVLVGAAIGLAWAVPAAIAGGKAYAEAIFWGQTAGRISESFAHERGFWWYLLIIWPMLLPWVIWPAFWKSLRNGRTALKDEGIRFCLVWFAAAFVIFSGVSGKQPHYLLPIVPAFAYVLVWLLPKQGDLMPRWHLLIAGGVFAIVGAAAIIVDVAWTRADNVFIEQAAVYGGVVVLIAGIVLISLKMPTMRRSIIALSATTVLGVVGAHLYVHSALRANYDLGPMALAVKDLQDKGRAIGHRGKYHGQFNYLGRLKQPVHELRLNPPKRRLGLGEEPPKVAADWFARNPDGAFVTYSELPPLEPVCPIYYQPYRSRFIHVWDVKDVAADMDIFLGRGKRFAFDEEMPQGRICPEK